jgi:glycosyltransferase involved in cell wall biosynthesis
LLREHSGLTYLVVGGPSPEGDMSERLQQQARALGVAEAVRFLGPMPAEELRVPLSAADLFVLATRNEGWANVILEAMACGLPVVATDVGGNSEVVCDPGLGTIVPFGDSECLQQAITAGLRTRWDVDAIRRYAASNTWDRRVAALVSEFRALHCATVNLQRNEEDLDRA